MAKIDQSFVSFFFDNIDKVGSDIVAHSYHQLIAQYSVFMWLLIAIYIGFKFIRAMQGESTFYDLMNHAFKIAIIMTLVTHYDYFCLFIYDIFTKEPLVIFKALSGGHGLTIQDTLDHFFHSGLDYSKAIFLNGSWYNVVPMIFGVIVLAATVLSVVFAAGLIVLSKCAAIILLALSPLFIFFALFPFTQGMFESYIRMLITFALIPVLTSVVLMILLTVTQEAVAVMNRADPNYLVCVPFLTLCCIQMYLMAQIYSKAAALGGGFALASFVSTMRSAKGQMHSTLRAGGKLTGILHKPLRLGARGQRSRVNT